MLPSFGNWWLQVMIMVIRHVTWSVVNILFPDLRFDLFEHQFKVLLFLSLTWDGYILDNGDEDVPDAKMGTECFNDYLRWTMLWLHENFWTTQSQCNQKKKRLSFTSLKWLTAKQCVHLMNWYSLSSNKVIWLNLCRKKRLTTHTNFIIPLFHVLEWTFNCSMQISCMLPWWLF